MTYIHFTEEQKYRASCVDLVEFLRRQGEKLIRSGPEYRMASDHSVTVRGNEWYDHASKEGGGPISFVQNYCGLSYPEAVTRLLDGEQGRICEPAPKKKEPKKEFIQPPVGREMRRLYAYLLKKRLIDREVLSTFVRAGLVYEDEKYHNAVFIGKDEHGVVRHAHKRSTSDMGKTFRINVESSDPRYSFHWNGTSDRLYVFEAPIDLLSFLTLYPKDWQQHSQDCISKKVIQNNGQLPKYLVQDHHEGIVSRDVFYAAQLEIARRRAQTGGTSKSAPTGRSKYSGKYILTNLMFCGHCGTGYRRCVWNKGGVKRAVWRCGSRLDYGAKYCKHSETLEEKPLQQAILNAINSVMDSRDALEVQLMGAMEQELAPIPGETMSLADIDRMLEELEKQFNSLLAEASAAGGTEDYAERFRMISNAMADLKEHKSRIKQVYQENELVSQRLKAASIAMSAYAAELTEWDQSVVYQLVEKVTVLAKDKIRVTFRNGTEVEQEIEQLDWRNAS